MKYAVTAYAIGGSGKGHRLGLKKKDDGGYRVVWIEHADLRLFTLEQRQKYLLPWRRRHPQYKVTVREVQPYPWLLLDTDTRWPDARVCRALNEVGRRLKRKLFIREGLRTRARQQELWEWGLRTYGYPAVLNYVARPGTSRHETGDAADVGVGSENGTNLGDYPGARQACAAVGLLFPMSWEPWHVEKRA